MGRDLDWAVMWQLLRDNAIKLALAAGTGVAWFLIQPHMQSVRTLLDLPGEFREYVDTAQAADAARDAGTEAAREAAIARDAAIRDELNALRTDVELLQLPKQVLEIGASSGPVAGFCVEGQECAITVRLRRAESAVTCKIVIGSPKFFFVQSETMERRQVAEVDRGRRDRNVGREWTDLDFAFITPRGLVTDENQGAFMFSASYTGCGGADDVSVVVDESPLVPVTIKSAVTEFLR